MLCSGFRCDQIHNCYGYDLGHTLLCYPRCSTNPNQNDTKKFYCDGLMRKNVCFNVFKFNSKFWCKKSIFLKRRKIIKSWSFFSLTSLIQWHGFKQKKIIYARDLACRFWTDPQNASRSKNFVNLAQIGI